MHTIVFPSFYQIFDFIGTLAFAISGARLAAGKDFDWFGAYVVGLTTAIGGGTMRDVLLGVTPFWMTNPIYLICSAIALIWIIIFKSRVTRQDHTWFLFDAIALAVFTVTGIDKTLHLNFPIWVAIFMGTLTGAAGGVFRDVLINEIPLIFRKDIYATACVAGGLIFYLCMQLALPAEVTAIISGVSVFVIRLLAVRFHIHLPLVHLDKP